MPQFLELIESWKGFTAASALDRPLDWDLRLAETVALIENHAGYPTHVHEFKVQEAMATADFPLLFADTIDRQMLAALQSIGTPLDRVFRKGKPKDFRTVKRFRHQGLVKRLPVVGEFGEYTERAQEEAEFSYALRKYGARIPFSWEMFVNDDLGAFNTFPQDLAQSAINTRAWFQTQLLFDSGGPIDAFFAAGRGQASVSVLTLSLANLITAVTEMMSYTSSTTEPILNRPKYLVVGPAHEILAKNILSTLLMGWTDGAGAVASHETSTQGLRDMRLELIVDDWLPLVATSKTSSWALVADPSQVAVAEFGLLRGQENPQIFLKDSNVRLVGRGSTSRYDGSFESDTIEYKVRDCFGGCTLDEIGVWGSTGAGS